MTDENDRPEPSEDDLVKARRAIEKISEEIRGEEPPIEFPVQGKADGSTVRLTRKREFLAWVGRSNQLLRVEALVDESLKLAFDSERPQLEKLSSFMRKSAIRELSPETVARGAGGRMVRQGSLESILAEMDATEIERLELGNASARLFGERPMIRVEFGRHPDYGHSLGGVLLEVTGSDRQWVSGAYDSLATEIAKGVPWWSRLRGTAGSIGSLAIGVLVAFLYVLVIGDSETESQLAVGLTGGMLGLIVSFGLNWLVQRWVFRDFEVIEPGGRSGAQKFWAGAVVAVGLASALVTLWLFLRP